VERGRRPLPVHQLREALQAAQDAPRRSRRDRRRRGGRQLDLV
jgi:hypothetical protein